MLLAASKLGVYVHRLCDSCGGSSRLNGSRNRSSGRVSVDLSLRAVAGDVTSLAASVASLAGSVERAAVGSSAITGDVSELATSIALHGLSLAVTGKVVGSTTLVAGSRARAASEAAPETTVATTRSSSTAAHSWVGAVASKMASKTAAVAASACASSTQAEGWAVSLDVPETLAVIALLGLGGARMWASVGLVSWLLAVVAKPFGRGAHLSIVAHVAALEACTTR